MDKAKIVEKAVLSVDAAYLKVRYPGKTYVPYGLVYGDKLTPRYKNRVCRSCSHGYPGGEIGAVVDHSGLLGFSKGYVFTEKGFFATKNCLKVVGDFSKEEMQSFDYVEITSVETVKKHDRYDYIRICTADDTYTGFANIYAPFLCEVLKKILQDLWGKPIQPTEYEQKEQERAAQKAAQEKKPNAEPEPAKEVIDMLWEEATAAGIQPMQPAPESPTVQEKKPMAEEKPAEEKPASDDPFELGVQAYQEKRYVEALALFRLAASRGSIEACYNVAVIMDRLGKTAKDYAEALTYLKKYRELGGAKDIRELTGALFEDYYYLTGTEAFQKDDYAQAEENLRKALKYNSVKSMWILASLLLAYEPSADRAEEAHSLAVKYAEAAECEADKEDARKLLQDITAVQKNYQALAALEAGDAEKAYALAKEAAVLGNMPAQFLAGELTAKFGETKQDFLDALGWLEQADRAGAEVDKDLTDFLRMHVLCLDGDAAIERDDPQEAANYFRQAAQLGATSAMYKLAVLLPMIADSRADLEEALTWAEACQKLQPEKDFGELIAHIRGDILIQEGNEAKKQKNPEKAKQCYQQAWDGGYEAAAMAMAVLLSAQATTAEEAEEALTWARKYPEDPSTEKLIRALETQRDTMAGVEACREERWEEAEALFRKAAEMGGTAAMCKLAVLLLQKGGSRDVLNEALAWADKYQKAEPGEKANDLVREILGHQWMWDGSEAVNNKDSEKALQCYKRAWELGKESAAFKIAALLYMEAKTEKDCLEAITWAKKGTEGKEKTILLEALETKRYFCAGMEAFNWEKWDKAIPQFRKAAELGNHDAYMRLVYCLLRNAKTKADLQEALSWAEKFREIEPAAGGELVKTVRDVISQ